MAELTALSPRSGTSIATFQTLTFHTVLQSFKEVASIISFVDNSFVSNSEKISKSVNNGLSYCKKFGSTFLKHSV